MPAAASRGPAPDFDESRGRNLTQGFVMATLTSAAYSGINDIAAVAATRGDLGQLAPRKKLLKSFSSFPEDFLRPSEHFGTEGFSFSLPAALIEFHAEVSLCRGGA
jgi:hypothetical protein